MAQENQKMSLVKAQAEANQLRQSGERVVEDIREPLEKKGLSELFGETAVYEYGSQISDYLRTNYQELYYQNLERGRAYDLLVEEILVSITSINGADNMPFGQKRLITEQFKLDDPDGYQNLLEQARTVAKALMELYVSNKSDSDQMELAIKYCLKVTNSDKEAAFSIAMLLIQAVSINEMVTETQGNLNIDISLAKVETPEYSLQTAYDKQLAYDQKSKKS